MTSRLSRVIKKVLDGFKADNSNTMVPVAEHPDKDFLYNNPYYDDEYVLAPCVVDREYYTHLRRYEDDGYGGVMLSNHGGATLCFKIVKGSIVGGDGHIPYWIMYTWAECNLKEKDQFCRKTGREQCLENFKTNPSRCFMEARQTLPSISETREYVSNQFKIYKSRFTKKVWAEYY